MCYITIEQCVNTHYDLSESTITNLRTNSNIQGEKTHASSEENNSSKVCEYFLCLGTQERKCDIISKLIYCLNKV
jgi:hypothetical protein